MPKNAYVGCHKNHSTSREYVRRGDVTLSNFCRQSYTRHTGEFPIGHTGENFLVPSYWRKKIVSVV